MPADFYNGIQKGDRIVTDGPTDSNRKDKKQMTKNKYEHIYIRQTLYNG